MRRTATLIGAVSLAVASPLIGQGHCTTIGDAGIHACVHAGDGPTIVLAAGAGQDARTWTPLIDELTRIGTVVSFDRPGLGRSAAAEGPRTPTAIALEMRDVLVSLRVSGTTLFVGHSMGGIHVLRYAAMFPESVDGVLLLDTPPPGFERERMMLLSDAERRQRLDVLARGRANAPDVVGRERDGATGEAWTFDGFPTARPVVVVVADGQSFGDLGSEAAHRELWLRLSRRWLDLSQEAELVVARGSGHMVHHDRPQLVLDQIRRLARAARSGPGRR